MGKGLEGLAVIEIGGGFAASSTGKALADLGAEVVKVEPPEGDPVRRRGVVPGCRAPAGGPFLHLNANKRSIVLDRTTASGRAELERLLGRADVVVREGRAPELEDVEPWRERHPRLVVVSITPFGLTGPRRGWRGDELTLVHAGGWGYIIPGRGAPREWPPIRPFGHHALIQAGLHAAVAALAACRGARVTGLGDHLDVSVQETVAFLLGRHFTSFEYARRIDHRSDRSIYEPMGFYPCRDGEVFIICPEQAQWQRMASLIGAPEWGASEMFASRDERGAHAAELRDRVSAWTRTRTSEEVFHALQAVRVGAAPVFDHARLAEQEHLRARDFFVPVDHPGAGRIELPGPPYRLRRRWWRLSRPAPALGEAGSAAVFADAGSDPRAPAGGKGGDGAAGGGPLRGVRVLDLSWVWAGPHCTMILGALGAEVLKVESSRRLDLTRRASVHARELSPGPNRNGYFNQLGQHKKSVGIDLSKGKGRDLVRRLAGESDVFVANFGTGVLERMGLGPDDLLAINPNLTVALISAFGQDGPLRLYTGYGPLISPLAGLSAVTGYAEDGRPRDVNMAYGDPNGGVHAAIAVAASLVARDLHGERGQVIDVAMWEAMMCTAFEGWMNHALGGEPYSPMGNRDPETAPCNVYPCRGDDRWVAIAAATMEEWEALCGAIGRPELASEPRFATAAARKANEGEIDRILAKWCASRDRWEVAERLQTAGVPAFPSVSSEDLRTDPHLAAREAFNTVEHPEVGMKAHFRVPWRWTRRANGTGSRAPCLGEHTGEVLRDILGLPENEIADLHARDVVESAEWPESADRAATAVDRSEPGRPAPVERPGLTGQDPASSQRERKSSMTSPVRTDSPSSRTGDPFPDPPSPRDDPRSGSPFPPDRPVPAPVSRPPGSSVSGSDPVSRPDGGIPASSNPDAPVRYEVPMPRGLFDRLTGHDRAPRCRYDMATGRAEFVAEPGPAHEGRATQVTRLVICVEDALDDAGHPPRFFLGRATRLMSDDGAFEPDECLFIDPPDQLDLREHDGYLDVRKGHPIPDLVVEIDRSVASSHKLAPYFRMGVREAWTFGRRDGARIWVSDPEAESAFRAADQSLVLPGLGRNDLQQLLGDSPRMATSWRSRQLAKRVARIILARQGRG